MQQKALKSESTHMDAEMDAILGFGPQVAVFLSPPAPTRARTHTHTRSSHALHTHALHTGSLNEGCIYLSIWYVLV
jgi:hypothetical protein